MRILTTATPPVCGDRLLPNTSHSSCAGLVTGHQDRHPHVHTRSIPQRAQSLKQCLQESPNQGEGPCMLFISETEHTHPTTVP